MSKARLVRVGAVGAACAAVGFGISALGSAGAETAKQPDARAGHFGHRFGGHRFLRGAVHAEAVIPVNGQFVTVTFDRGFVQSVSGNDLTIREGTANKTYKTVTLTIPTGATVRNDRHAAQLSSLQSGEHVLVFHGPNRTLVAARHGG